MVGKSLLSERAAALDSKGLMTAQTVVSNLLKSPGTHRFRVLRGGSQFLRLPGFCDFLTALGWVGDAASGMELPMGADVVSDYAAASDILREWIVTRAREERAELLADVRSPEDLQRKKDAATRALAAKDYPLAEALYERIAVYLQEQASAAGSVVDASLADALRDYGTALLARYVIPDPTAAEDADVPEYASERASSSAVSSASSDSDASSSDDSDATDSSDCSSASAPSVAADAAAAPADAAAAPGASAAAAAAPAAPSPPCTPSPIPEPPPGAERRDNGAGRLAWKALNGRWYCGVRGLDADTPLCDGTCGPDNGDNCPHCRALEALANGGIPPPTCLRCGAIARFAAGATAGLGAPLPCEFCPLVFADDAPSTPPRAAGGADPAATPQRLAPVCGACSRGSTPDECPGGEWPPGMGALVRCSACPRVWHRGCAGTPTHSCWLCRVCLPPVKASDPSPWRALEAARAIYAELRAAAAAAAAATAAAAAAAGGGAREVGAEEAALAVQEGDARLLLAKFAHISGAASIRVRELEAALAAFLAARAVTAVEARLLACHSQLASAFLECGAPPALERKHWAAALSLAEAAAKTAPPERVAAAKAVVEQLRRRVASAEERGEVEAEADGTTAEEQRAMDAYLAELQRVRNLTPAQRQLEAIRNGGQSLLAAQRDADALDAATAALFPDQASAGVRSASVRTSWVSATALKPLAGVSATPRATAPSVVIARPSATTRPADGAPADAPPAKRPRVAPAGAAPVLDGDRKAMWGALAAK